MKKLLKSKDKKIIITLLMIMLLLSTVAIYQIYAAVSNESASEGNSANKVSKSGKYFTLNDLLKDYDILCSWKSGDSGSDKGHIPNPEDAVLEVGNQRLTTTESGKEIGKLVPKNAGKNGETVLTSIDNSKTSKFKKSKYYAQSYSKYTVASTNTASPKEAYILAEMAEEERGGTVWVNDYYTGLLYSEIQYAWWTTGAGNNSGVQIKNRPALVEESSAFEKYIKKLTKNNSNSFADHTYKYEVDGKEKELTVSAPVLNYNPTWNEDVKPTVSWDSDKQTWTVGPFSINYVEASYSSGTNNRPDVTFAGITNAELYTDKGKVEKEHWKFNFIRSKVRDSKDGYEYPYANEEFYIELDFMEDVTKITNLHFDFKYMNAGGQYDLIKGKYYEQIWRPETKQIREGEYKHTLRLTGMVEKNSQLLAYGIKGARWYEQASLDLDISDIRFGSFKIYKKIVDENGNELQDVGTNDNFTFEIYKNGKLYNTVNVKPNRPYTSPLFTWKEGETAPKFEVKEVLKENGGYKQYGDIEVTGTLEGKDLAFTAKNYPDVHKGYVSIEKVLYEREVASPSGTIDFNFKLYIDGKPYMEAGKTDEYGTIHVKNGETWTSNVITWIGDNAPSYKVTEINMPEGYELVNLENDTGKLIDGKTANVIAKNRVKPIPYTIELKKVIEGNVTTDDVFTFNVRVDNENFTKTLKANETWTETFWRSSTVAAPEYEVTEINVPNGWEKVRIDNESGSLTPNGTVNVIAVNAPSEQSATIDITKHTVSNDKTDDEFTIVVEVSGTFKIGDEEIVNGTKVITTKLHAEETVSLGPVIWKGEAPTYNVTETEIPSNWKLQNITNSSGQLENGKKVEVLCTNHVGTTKEGFFQIKKVIVDKDGKELTNVDLDKEFIFEIYKDGKLYDTVKVTPNKPYNSSIIHWKAGEEVPKFEVKEVLKEDSGYKQYGEILVEGELEAKTLKFTAKNCKEQNKGYVAIEKKQQGTGLENMDFNFNLYINDKLYVEAGKTDDNGTIHVKVGETWVSNEITWEGNKAPKYEVKEINIPNVVELVGIQNSVGNLEKNKTVKAIATNKGKTLSGTLILKKVIAGNVDSNDTFTFTVKVGEDTFTKTLKAGQSWKEDFSWEYGTKAPDYEVIEIDIPDGWKQVEIKNAKGTLGSNQTVNVTAINEAEKEKSAIIKIHKETISDDKEGVDENNDVFTFVTKISGTFEMGGESIVKGTKVITSKLKTGDTVTLDKITWKGDDPTYTVTETELPDGWKLKEITNNNGTLKDEKTVEVNCTNEYGIRVEYDLTMEMAGKVWEDVALKPEDKNTEYSKPNGKYDANIESGIPKVEVVIWKKCYDASGNEIVSLRKYATGYEEGSNSVIDFPLYTSEDGLWVAPRMSVPGLTDEEKNAGAVKADYDVEFAYDGQTYKPTDFLKSGTAEQFKKATNKQKDQYKFDSMAFEVAEERQAFDNKFETITGDKPIDDNGITEGYSLNANGERTDLLYESGKSISLVGGSDRKISNLKTTDSEGYIREQYKMKSRTSTGDLTYPFDDKVHLESINKTIDKINGGMVVRYVYSATYPYLLNVNLGLVKRDEANLAVTKDVYSAAVTVNQKLLNYKYNEYVDFESDEYKDYLKLQLQVAEADISYKLDLYESDYYYRAKVYENNTDLTNGLETFYKKLNKLDNVDLSKELDLDVFLTYKINIYNASDSYLAKVKSIIDYYDEDLELVSSDVYKYVQEVDGKQVNEKTLVAQSAYAKKKGFDEANSVWGELNFENGQKTKAIGNIDLRDNKSYTGSEVVTTDNDSNNNSENKTVPTIRKETSKTYNKAVINLNDFDALKVNEKLELYLTYKVKRDEAPARFENSAIEEVNSYVRLGTKSNIAEVGSYTTYYLDGKVAGKVDKNSAPNNLDIENKNDKSWYEDVTDSAPIITLDLYSESRDVSGLAWEDSQTEKLGDEYYNQVVGNGKYDAGERLIGNLTTMMVEKVTVKKLDENGNPVRDKDGNELYVDYDFVWPTDQKFSFLNNKSLEDITHFDSITLTSNNEADKGTYKFTNVPAGNYVVRFEYGNYPSDHIDNNGFGTGDLKGKYSEPKPSNEKIAVYNGQDFKTTAYQVDVDKKGNAYINDNDWYDFKTAYEYDDGKVKMQDGKPVLIHNSDAIDNEARRLEVMAYSKVLDNTVTNVLASANDYTADHKELYKNTSMFADTAKINLNIENMKLLKTSDDSFTNTVIGKTYVNGKKDIVNRVDYTYKVEAVDIGLEERSNTELVLDKEIESISLTTNSGDQILKAVYDINYNKGFGVDKDTGKSTYKAEVTLNTDKSFGTSNLMAQNKDEEKGLQNFRYIYYDNSIAQGLNLEVVYRFTVLNIGEVDRTSKELAKMSATEINSKAQELKAQVYKKVNGKLENIAHQQIGKYVGSIYYLGKNGSKDDAIVTTKARQLIDYVDNNAVFKADDNTDKNNSWKVVTVDELLAGKVIDSSIIENNEGANTILDDRGVAYTTAERSNLVLSVDNAKDEDEKLTNPGFIVDLVPYSASSEKGNTDKPSCQAAMKMVITRTIDSQISDDDLAYDNIAEIVKLENTVGRRDIETIAGNVDPKGSKSGESGEFAASLDERDSSATELITFTPPTGLGVNTSLKIEILIVSLAALAILGTGIVLIKKYVIK